MALLNLTAPPPAEAVRALPNPTALTPAEAVRWHC